MGETGFVPAGGERSFENLFSSKHRDNFVQFSVIPSEFSSPICDEEDFP